MTMGSLLCRLPMGKSTADLGIHGHGQSPPQTAHFLGWTISRHNLVIYWTYLGFVFQYLSKICLSHRYCDIHVFGNNFGTWTTNGQKLDFLESRDCPFFVHLQCDQMVNVKK